MLIDWFTVGAQVLNFLILIWLMKRYLYQPILRTIDAREARIAAELSEADKARAEASQERAEFQRKNEVFDEQRAALLRTAGEEASAERQRLIAAAQIAADALSAQREKAFKREQQSLKDEINRRTCVEVFAIARKTLGDLAGTTLEACIVEAFTRRLRALDGVAKETLATAIKAAQKPGAEPAHLRSAFVLPQEQCAAIRQALNETFSCTVPIDFATAPEVISGIEFTAGGQKIAWSIGDYLSSMEQRLGELSEASAVNHASTPETVAGAEAVSKPEVRDEPGASQEAEPAVSGKSE